MIIGIMQPYFLPYIGYFQLINAVDKFVLYDNIEFTKKGWINRNRILVNGQADYISVPVKKDSDYLKVNERKLADSFQADSHKILRKLSAAYQQAPEFKTVYPLVESVFEFTSVNLFDFIYQSVVKVNHFLGIKTELIISSTIPVNHGIKSQEKVIAICQALGATSYLNPIGGTGLYKKGSFSEKHIDLNFIQSSQVTYQQFNNEFVPWLSIIDVMMFNPPERINEYLVNNYDII